MWCGVGVVGGRIEKRKEVVMADLERKLAEVVSKKKKNRVECPSEKQEGKKKEVATAIVAPVSISTTTTKAKEVVRMSSLSSLVCQPIVPRKNAVPEVHDGFQFTYAGAKKAPPSMSFSQPLSTYVPAAARRGMAMVSEEVKDGSVDHPSSASASVLSNVKEWIVSKEC